jgi:hypothetical protein
VAQTFSNPGAQGSVATCNPRATPRLDAPASLRFWHLASFDAPTVAVIWSLAFAWAARVRLPLWIPILLALSAWAVYVADRLLDARAALHAHNVVELRQRHLFHHRHRRLLAPSAVAAACAAGCIIYALMPALVRERDSVLGAAALAYFTGVHSSRAQPVRGFFGRLFSRKPPILSKELLVGLLFTTACTLPAFSRAAVQGSHALWPLSVGAAFFALLAWLNCHAIDRWESEPSLSNSGISTPAFILAVAGLPVAYMLQPRFAALITVGAASALLLAILDRFRSRLTPLALRVAADLVLLTPLSLLALPPLLTR